MEFSRKIEYSFIFIGPDLPKELQNHEMVRIGFDLLAIGGYNEYNISDGALFKLSCINNTCKWETMKQKLKIPRYYFVAVPVPDDFVKCNDN